MARPSMQLLISEVRKRILDLVKGDPSQLRNVHKQFDVNGSGNLTIDEWSNMISKLKIAVERKYVYPFFKFVDQDNSGNVSAEEFIEYVLNY